MLQQLCWRLLIALSRSDHVLSWKVENEDQIKLVLSGNWLTTYSIKKTYLSKDQKKKKKTLAWWNVEGDSFGYLKWKKDPCSCPSPNIQDMTFLSCDSVSLEGCMLHHIGLHASICGSFTWKDNVKKLESTLEPYFVKGKIRICHTFPTYSLISVCSGLLHFSCACFTLGFGL